MVQSCSAAAQQWSVAQKDGTRAADFRAKGTKGLIGSNANMQEAPHSQGLLIKIIMEGNARKRSDFLLQVGGTLRLRDPSVHLSRYSLRCTRQISL